jgi:metallo-beta-lactamase class B
MKAAAQHDGSVLAQKCEGRDGWSDPAPPAHIYGNVFMVGTCGITVLLITSKQGHILIDGATQDAAASIAENIRNLGFKLSDVRYLLSSHEHLDHVGGLAELKRLTGAQMIARPQAVASLETGQSDHTDPQKDVLPPFIGIRVDRTIMDGELVKLGRIHVKALATPGHSPGGTSWTWKSCEEGKCFQFVYADSLSAVSAQMYKFTKNPEYVATLRNTIQKIGSLTPCDILVTPHPSQSQFFQRLSGKETLVNPNGCRNYAIAAANRLNTRLTEEVSR